MGGASSQNMGLLGKGSKRVEAACTGRILWSRGTAHPGMTQQGGSQENHTPYLLHLPSCISCWCPSLAEVGGQRSMNVQPTEFSIPSREQGSRRCGADPERRVHDGQPCGQVTPIFFPFGSCSGQYLGNRGKLSTAD